MKKGDEGYGEPVGLTKERGAKAQHHIYQVRFSLFLKKIKLIVHSEKKK